MITFLNEKFPFTGRKCPENAKLQVFIINPKWRDLCYFDEKRNGWFYLSTLPNYNHL